MASSSSSQNDQVLPQQPQPCPSPPPAQAGMAADDESTPPLSKPVTGVNPELPAQGSTSSTRAYPNIHLPENMRFPWMFDPLTGAALDQAGTCLPMVPILCPLPFSGYPGQVEERQLRNAGIFAVPMVPVIGPFPGYPPSGLIPISYNLPQNAPLPGNINNPTASQPGDRAVPAQAQEAAALGPLQDAGLHFPAPAAAAAQAGQAQLMHEGQRQIVRRFHVAFQIDLLLILKLAVVVFIFNQDGSKDRLFLLLVLAGVIYLYQTGALTPLLRWISQSAQRAMLPPQQQQPVRAVPADAQLRGQVQGENAAAAAAANAAAPVAGEPVPAAADNQAGAPGGAGMAADNVAGGHAQQQAPAQGAPWWGILKEVQMLVVGFVTSLLPGFHQHMD